MSEGNPFVFTRENCEVVSEFAQSNSLLKETLNSKTHWNKLTIKNGTRFSKNEVLLLICKTVYPHDLLPCLYHEEYEDTSFLFRNGFTAVMTLCSRKLTLIDPESNENIELAITARYKSFEEEPFDPDHVLNAVLAKRVFDGKNIDLRNLRSDIGLRDIFCDFRSRKFSEYLFEAVANHVLKPHLVLMSHNQIESLDVLEGLHKHFIAVLDLRHNSITREGFHKINSTFSIGHLLLEGNPITTEYVSLNRFAREVRKKLNWLSHLDFMELDESDPLIFIKVPTFLRKRSFKSFVDHFMFHYFTLLYKNKDQLAALYHPEATFTLSLFKLSDTLGQTPQNSLAIAASEINHNILPEERLNRSLYQNVFIGPREIKEALKKIPDLECPFSVFSVDVPIIVNDVVVVISCSGPCRMVLRGHQQLYRFSRTFILVPSPSNAGEWVIANDMWNINQVVVRPLSSKTVHRSYKTPVFELATGDYSVMMNPQLKDRTILRRIVKKLTKMKPIWVERFLEESDWDLEFTLQAFTDQFKADVIPVDAFDIPPQNLKMLGKMVGALKMKQARLGIDTGS